MTEEKKWNLTILSVGLKNYFTSLKYFFTPLGTLFLGVALGLSVALPALSAVFAGIINEINGISQSVNLSVNDVWKELVAEFGKLPLSNPFELLRIIFGTDWAFNTMNGVLQRLLVDYTQVSEQITAMIASAEEGFKACWNAFLLCLLLGLFAGYFLTKFLIRRRIAKRAFWKFLIVSLLESTVAAALISACAYFAALWKLSFPVTAFISVLLFGFISFFEACAVHSKSVEITKRIITVRNILLLLACNIIIMTVAVVLTILAVAWTNILLGICIALPLMEIAFQVTGMNAESYVKKVCAQAAAEKQIGAETELLPSLPPAESDVSAEAAATDETENINEPDYAESANDKDGLKGESNN